MGDLYIPDTNKWIKFFRNLNSGKFNSYQYGRGQKGSGIGNFSRGTYMIPVDPHVKDDDVAEDKKQSAIKEQPQPIIKMVSPVAANLEQAKSYLKQDQEQEGGARTLGVKRKLSDVVEEMEQKRRRRR